MTCEVCGAPTGWTEGVRLERANESKREAFKRARIAEKQRDDLLAVVAMCKETMRRVIRHPSHFEYSSLQQAMADCDATIASVKGEKV